MPSSVTGSVVRNPLLPEQTYIYNAKGRTIFLAFILAIWLVAGIALVSLKMYLIGSILILLILAGFFITYKVFADRSAQLIISYFGITTIADGFHTWNEISEEEVVKYGHGRQRSYYLVYRHPAGNVKLDIGWLNIKHKELQHLLEAYRIAATFSVA